MADLRVGGRVPTASVVIVNSTNAAASTSAYLVSGTWFTGGSATTTKPQLLIEPSGTSSTTWSVNGTGLGVNAASGFVGNLLDLKIAGTSSLKVSNVGVVIGVAALATTATTGFLYIPSCAGPPTGVPSAQTGTVPLVFDSTDNTLYVYNAGWKGVVVA